MTRRIKNQETALEPRGVRAICELAGQSVPDWLSAASGMLMRRQRLRRKRRPPAPAWNGMFFIYDRSGKEELLSKAVLRMRGAEKDIPKLTRIDGRWRSCLEGRAKRAESRTGPNSASMLSAPMKWPVFEEILNVVNGKAAGSHVVAIRCIPGSETASQRRSIGIFSGHPQCRSDCTECCLIKCSAASESFVVDALKVDSVHSRSRAYFPGRRQNAHERSRSWEIPLPADSSTFLPTDKPIRCRWAIFRPRPFITANRNSICWEFTTRLKRAFTTAGSSQKQAVSPLEQMAETRLGMPSARSAWTGYRRSGVVPEQPHAGRRAEGLSAGHSQQTRCAEIDAHTHGRPN